MIFLTPEQLRALARFTHSENVTVETSAQVAGAINITVWYLNDKENVYTITAEGKVSNGRATF